LGVERSFKYREDGISKVIGHGKTPAQERRRRVRDMRSVCQQLFYMTDANVETPGGGL
jgi:hypothetical protein